MPHFSLKAPGAAVCALTLLGFAGPSQCNAVGSGLNGAPSSDQFSAEDEETPRGEKLPRASRTDKEKEEIPRLSLISTA